jgi:hypothetical protein
MILDPLLDLKAASGNIGWKGKSHFRVTVTSFVLRRERLALIEFATL